MRLVFTALAALFIATESFAASSGTLTCHFEFMTTAAPGTFIKTPPFTFDVMDNYFNHFSFPELQNKLHIAYYPGLVAKDDLRMFVINLKYASANSGADVPAVDGGSYVFKISQDASDLIGAFMNCTSELK